MKIIYVDSKKHGKKEILVDDEDYEFLIQFKWHINKQRNTFYAHHSLRVDKKGVGSIIMHRMLLNICDKDILVDHRNHNGLDNRKINIRTANTRQNAWNTSKSKNRSSKFIGVHFDKQPRRDQWVALIQIGYKNTFRKRFTSEIEAAKARDEKAKELFGEFASLNFP